jgi:uncharacterized protein YjiS (DUF1127 family)
MAYATDIFTPGISLGERFNTLRQAIAEKRAQNRAYRATFDELDRLSDRELADLGIARSNIRGIAYEASLAAR